MPAADIRDQPSIDHADVMALNFINHRAPYRFRRHFRQGMRSHIMEILDPADVATESRGQVVDGVRWFPKAVPRRMLRLFRTRLDTLDTALAEIRRIRAVEQFLAPDFMATSAECIVEYHAPSGKELLLCGFQEYVSGEIIDPWSVLGHEELLAALRAQVAGKMGAGGLQAAEWIKQLQNNAALFVDHIKAMIAKEAIIPDLAGAGNIMATTAGQIRLVDINNISPVVFDGPIHLDEKGYPVCDKSIEALALIEEKIAGQPVDRHEPLFAAFLAPERCRQVAAFEARFRESRAPR